MRWKPNELNPESDRSSANDRFTTSRGIPRFGEQRIQQDRAAIVEHERQVERALVDERGQRAGEDAERLALSLLIQIR